MTDGLINCDCAKEVTADFEFWEGASFLPNPKLTLTDTAYHSHYVEFRAKLEDADYTWYIGSDIKSGPVSYIYFESQWAGQDIPITLVVKKKENKICFPYDDGYDSVVKMIHISEYWKTENGELNIGPIEGVYRVKSPLIEDSFEVEFYASYGIQNQAMFNVINYDGLGSECVDNARISGSNYRQVWTSQGTGTTVCASFRGYIHNRMDGVTEMKFKFDKSDPDQPEYIEVVYKGRKI